MNKFTMNCFNVLGAALSNLSGCLMCLTFLFILATPGLPEFRALDVHSPNLLLGMPPGDYAQQEFVFRTLYVSCIDREKNQPRFVACRSFSAFSTTTKIRNPVIVRISTDLGKKFVRVLDRKSIAFCYASLENRSKKTVVKPLGFFILRKSFAFFDKLRTHACYTQHDREK